VLYKLSLAEASTLRKSVSAGIDKNSARIAEEIAALRTSAVPETLELAAV